MLPSYIVLALFMGYPLINCVRLAFSNYKLTQLDHISFAGLSNFRRVFTDPEIKMIAANTVKFVAITLILQLLLGFILAMVLRRPFRGRGFYQGIVFLPWAFSGFVVGLIFQWMFNAEFGPIVDVLMKTGILNHKISFLGNPQLSIYTVILALTWQGIPFFGMMILAALQSVSEELIEAAKLDGATAIQRFYHIIIPSIKPTLVVTTMLRTIWIFNSSDLIYIMTKGGPVNSSHTLSSYMFVKAYNTLDFGFASALGTLFMFGLSIYAFVYIKVSRFNEENG